MSTLTSWKEIAQYLGKGVRTVQRWEQLLDLPVRRPAAKAKGIVLADTAEIDEWISSATARPDRNSGSEVDRLQRMVAELLTQNCELRAQLEHLRGITSSMLSSGPTAESVADRYEPARRTGGRPRLQREDLVEPSDEAGKTDSERTSDGAWSRFAS